MAFGSIKLNQNATLNTRQRSKCHLSCHLPVQTLIFSSSYSCSEAIETRHALHGVRWPASNPKCLNVDFGSEKSMDKAIASTTEQPPSKEGVAAAREERVSGGWDRFEVDERKVFHFCLMKNSQPIRYKFVIVITGTGGDNTTDARMGRWQEGGLGQGTRKGT